MKWTAFSFIMYGKQKNFVYTQVLMVTNNFNFIISGLMITFFKTFVGDV